MADQKVSALTELTVPPDPTDEIEIVDKSDTSMAASGTNKRIQYSNLGKQPLDADLTAIAALTSAADKVPYATGAGAWAMADLSSFARTILDDTTNSAVRTTIGAATIPLTQTLASATTFAISAGVWFVIVTGTTTISTITGDQGHPVTLKFNGAVTVTAGTGIRLAGGTNFVSTAHDTLTIASDDGSTTWWEVGRSLNA